MPDVECSVDFVARCRVAFVLCPASSRLSRRIACASIAFLAACGAGTSGDKPPPPAPSATAEAAPAPSPLPVTSTTALALPADPPPPPEPEPLRARFLSVGDVIFGRRIAKVIARKGDPDHPFRPLAKLYADVDFTFANLENPFTTAKKPNETPAGKRYAVLWARPESVQSLVKYKFTAVNLANNHALDQDLDGVKETLRTLDAAGIQHVGVGLDLAAAWTPMFVDVRGLKIGFVGASFASKNDMGMSRNNYVARIEDEKRLAAAVKKAREGAQFVVVTFHAGDEHKFTPNAAQKAFVKAAVRSGADIVIGGHPHVVQPAEKVDGKWVFYSIGNYIFDQAAVDNSEALAVELVIKLPPGAARAEIEKLLVHPIVIEEGAPGPADDARAAKILGRAGLPGRELTP